MTVADKADLGSLASIPVAPVEKRKSPRYAFSAAVDASDILGDTRIIGRLSDISRNGCYVDTISPFAMNADVAMKITRGNESFTTEAKVVYSSIGMGMGLLFTTCEPQQVATLEMWLGELSGEKVRPPQKPSTPILETKKATAGNDSEIRQVVGELVALLNGKGILDDSEGMSLLRKLSR